MKKTIIASAIAAAVAAPAAFADVSISGMVNPEFSDADAATGMASSTNTDLVIKGSEDLGNGMKASFKHHTFNDDGGNSVADTSVTIAGDFGTISTGRMETINMATFHSKADNDASHDINMEDNNGQQSRLNMVKYSSPSMNGLKFHVGLGVGVGDAAGADATDGSDDADTQEFALTYSNGGLSAGIATTTQEDGANDEEVMNIFAKYKMDNLTVHVAHRDVENNNGTAASDNKYTVYGASYAMGANTFAVAVADSDDAQDGDYTLSAKHALSKRTSVYLTIFEDDSADQETTLVGVKHTF